MDEHGINEDCGVIDSECMEMLGMNPNGYPGAELFYSNASVPSTMDWGQTPMVGQDIVRSDFASQHVYYPEGDHTCSPGYAQNISYLCDSSRSSSLSQFGSGTSSITSQQSFGHAYTLSDGSPPPQSPPPVRTTSPVHMFPDTAPPINPDILLGHMYSGMTCNFDSTAFVASNMGHVNSSLRRFVCQECGQSSFSREAELKRHISEQHRCPHEDCKAVKFSSSGDKDDHHKIVHHNQLGHRCGKCLLEGQLPNTLPRLDKLKEHYRKVHHLKATLELFKCKHPACVPDKFYGGLFFDTKEALKKHEQNSHSDRANSMAISSFDKDFSDGGMAKRPSSPAMLNEAKRWKTDFSADDYLSRNMLRESSSNSEAPPSVHCGSPENGGHSTSREHCSQENSRVDSLFSPSPGSEDSVKKEETLSLSMMKIRALTKLDEWDDFLESLQNLDITATVDSRNTAIKLRSSSTANLSKGNRYLQQLVSSIQLTVEFQHKALHNENSSMQFSHQDVAVHTQPKIFALDVNRDADLIAMWNDHLLEKFPKLVRDADIQGRYSVSFVRQIIQETSRPVIRFRSVENPDEESRRLLRIGVKRMCAIYIPLEDIPPILFSQGAPVRLIGDDFDPSTLDDPLPTRRFPHERRYYPMCGMGVSLGVSECPSVSATSGGLIKVDGRMYMLTVDHLFDACSTSRTAKVQSPSISDARYVYRQSERKLRELERQIQNASPDEVPLPEVAQRLFPADIDEQWEQYSRILNESKITDENLQKYAFGTLRHRSGVGQSSQRKSVNPKSSGSLHLMDWSLIEITAKERKGKNVLRYGRTTAPTLSEITAEISQPYGTGNPCLKTAPVNGDELAHYVGTTSGFRQGTVNSTLVLQCHDEEDHITYEWALIVPGGENLRDTAFKGDSGAWIINDEDKLLGQLWGWDNSYILFTPIADIFADIAQRLNTTIDRISLPDHQTRGLGNRACRISTESLRTEFEETHINETGFQSNPAFLSPVSVPTSGRTSRASSWCSVGSIPSLVSSMSTSSEAEGVQQGPPSPAEPDYDLDMQDISMRCKEGVPPKISVGDWVVLQSGDINEKLSALRITDGALPDTVF